MELTAPIMKTPEADHSVDRNGRWDVTLEVHLGLEEAAALEKAEDAALEDGREGAGVVGGEVGGLMEADLAVRGPGEDAVEKWPEAGSTSAAVTRFRRRSAATSGSRERRGLSFSSRRPNAGRTHSRYSPTGSTMKPGSTTATDPGVRIRRRPGHCRYAVLTQRPARRLSPPAPVRLRPASGPCRRPGPFRRSARGGRPSDSACGAGPAATRSRPP